jgi:hypothetical protein
MLQRLFGQSLANFEGRLALSRAMQIDPVQIAAFGTLISLTTLILTLYFRWRDSRTRLEITYVLAEHLGDVPPAWQKETTSYAPLGVHGPSIVFRVLNKSSFAVTVSAAYLDLGGGEVVQREEGALPPDRQLAPGRPFIGAVRMDAVIGRLVDLGYSGTPEIQLVVEDSLGKRYTKQVKIPNIEDSEYARNRKPDDGAGGETDAG